MAQEDFEDKLAEASELEGQAEEIVEHVACALTVETEADFRVNLNEAKDAASRLIAAIDELLKTSE